MAPGMSVFRVRVPADVEPGQEFQVVANDRIVRIRCPVGTAPGQFLQITVQADPTPPADSPPMPPDSPNVERVEDDPSDNPAYMVTIPAGVRGGQQFPVTVRGQQFMVTAPNNGRPGRKIRVVPPPSPPPATDITASPEQTNTPRRATSSSSHASSQQGSVTSNGSSQSPRRPRLRTRSTDTQLFEVQVPPGVQPGQPFALIAGGVRILVTCPVDARPGQPIQFKVPLALTQAGNRGQPHNEAAKIKLSYNKDGWTRTIRMSDMKFQWVRMDDKGGVDSQIRFDVNKSAYVRKLVFRPGPDVRIRDGILSLVPATEAACDSRIKGANDEDLVTYADIANAQGKGFEGKAQWFQDKCKLLAVDYQEAHMRINVRRGDLLEDSVNAVMSLSRKDLRKKWRFEFLGEMGLDAGGLAREWFQLVTEEVFDGNRGLWQSSEANQMCMEINPASRKYFQGVSLESHIRSLKNLGLPSFISLPSRIYL